MMDRDFERRLRRTIGGSQLITPRLSPYHSPSSAPFPSAMKGSLAYQRRPEYSDRFIPIREPEAWSARYSMINEFCTTNSVKNSKRQISMKEQKKLAYQALLRNELLGAEIEDINEVINGDQNKPSYIANHNLFRFRTHEVTPESISPYPLSPISIKSQKMLSSPRKAERKISKTTYKVLDAPGLKDDYYLNLLDWSSTNVLSVGLGTGAYIWNADTAKVTLLHDFKVTGNSVTSVSFSEIQGNCLAVGTNRGFVQIWDVSAGKLLQTFENHTARVGALSWNGNMLSSGGRDRRIFLQDVRVNESEFCLDAHEQEVCGLKWSPDGSYLASGGNDNQLFIWSPNSPKPMQTYTDHLAAVKAIAWSPHQHGLLASGGGTADRCIRFWSTLTGKLMKCVDTGSQVCNLAWSKHSAELVSTHGYPTNEIIVWKYPSLAQLGNLRGQSTRVLYFAMSPDGESIVTGACDETLYFWKIFEKMCFKSKTRSVLDLFSGIR